MCLLSDSCRWSVAGIGSCFGITICVSNAQVKHNPNGVQQSKQQLLRLDREREREKNWLKIHVLNFWKGNSQYNKILSENNERKLIWKVLCRCSWRTKQNWLLSGRDEWYCAWAHDTQTHTRHNTVHKFTLFRVDIFIFNWFGNCCFVFFFSSFNLFLFVIQLLLLCIFHFFAFTLAHQWTKYAVGICYLRCAATTANR